VAELKQLGFKFALDDVVEHSPDVQQLVDLVDVVKVDLQAIDRANLPQLAASLKSKKLLAEKVETYDEFRQCLELGFDYFQGYYFARPAILSGKTIAPSEMVVLHLLELMYSKADDEVIETAVKRDALISLNLLRLVNSRAAGTGRRIESVSQALTGLGRHQLQRWLQILLYAMPSGRVELNSPLLQMATTRGKLLELMARRLWPIDGDIADRAFTVGIMSLSDALFAVPMPEILGRVEVADDVRSALLDRHGEFGLMLAVVEQLESADCGKPLTVLLKKLGLTAKQMRDIELEAFDWVQGLAHEVH
jgi:EAL and modified HD-GYP domain-containing signal transduction protein